MSRAGRLAMLREADRAERRATLASAECQPSDANRAERRAAIAAAETNFDDYCTDGLPTEITALATYGKADAP